MLFPIARTIILLDTATKRKEISPLGPTLHHINREVGVSFFLHKKCNSRNAKFIPDPHGDDAGVAHKPHLTQTAKTSTESNHQSPIILAGELHSAPYMYVRIWETQ